MQVIYIAMNVPVARALSTPLTWAMWRAARGPLADSIGYYATTTNVFAALGQLGLRDGSLKCIFALDSGRSSLFDLDADPRERVNLADRYPERVRWYVENLKGWSAAQKQRLAR